MAGSGNQGQLQMSDLSDEVPSQAVDQPVLVTVEVGAEVGVDGVGGSVVVKGQLLPAVELIASWISSFMAAGASWLACHAEGLAGWVTVLITLATMAVVFMVSRHWFKDRPGRRQR